MDDGDFDIRVMAILQLLLEIRARIAAFEIRLVQAEQSLEQRWDHAQ